jgi:sucrose phosphorylase
MKNQAQLIAYVDRLSGGTFHDLERLLDGPLREAFGGVHVLPFFHPIDGADAGFDPIDHTDVDPRLGSWDDVRALASRTEIMADMIVNHISRRSPQFIDFDARGEASPYAGLFLTFARVFPRGASEADLLALHAIRPGLPFTQHQTAHGERVLLWSTFTSEQIDIDVHHPEGRRYLDAILERFQSAGIRAIRVDAAGFAVKKAGTSCFMIPETLAFIADLTARARARGLEVLVEVHGHYLDQARIAGQVDWVYDFVLPPLVLHTLYTRDATSLRRWIDLRPRNSVTVLDTHDGIGVVDAGPDRDGHPGLLTPAEIRALVKEIHERSGGQSLEATGSAASNLDADQINCTFYDALGGRDDEHLVARAIQCFLPGIPQVYYVGLLAGRNDMTLLARTGVGRDINRHYFTADEVQQQLGIPIVERTLALLQLRNAYPAFAGAFDAGATTRDRLVLKWSLDRDWIKLDVDLTEIEAVITCSATGAGAPALVWCSMDGTTRGANR